MKNYGFEVSLNGKKLCSAGFGAKHFVTSAILTSARRVLDDGEDFSLYVGGLNCVDDKHYDWVNQNLKGDDEITIKVISDNFEKGKVVEFEGCEIETIESKLKTYYKLKEELKEHLK